MTSEQKSCKHKWSRDSADDYKCEICGVSATEYEASLPMTVSELREMLLGCADFAELTIDGYGKDYLSVIATWVGPGNGISYQVPLCRFRNPLYIF